MKCVLCENGGATDGATTVTIGQDRMVLVLRGVPARVCGDCGEAYVSGDLTQEILKRTMQIQEQGVEIDVRRLAVA